MSILPRRVLIHDQMVALLREGITAGRWVDEMPSEGELCREFQVSRMTLRKALAELANENWLTLGGRGKFHRIHHRKEARRVEVAGKVIRVLVPYGLSELGSITHVQFETLVKRVSAAGYRVEFEHHPHLFEKFSATQMARLEALPDTAAWLLLYATEPIQRWFQESGKPTAVVGMLHEGITLPHVYSDSQATARHAAGMLCARGHKELVYFIARITSVGDRLMSEVFSEEARRFGARVRIVEHEADATSVVKALVEVMKSKPSPTACFSSCAEHCVTILCALQAGGVKVPSQVSVVSGWDEFCLEFTYPLMARYRTDGVKMGKRTAEMLLGVIRHGTGKMQGVAVMPEYLEGGTLGAGPGKG